MVKSGRNHGEGKGGKTISKNTAKFLSREDVFSCDMDDFVKKRKHFFPNLEMGTLFCFFKFQFIPDGKRFRDLLLC